MREILPRRAAAPDEGRPRSLGWLALLLAALVLLATGCGGGVAAQSWGSVIPVQSEDAAAPEGLVLAFASAVQRLTLADNGVNARWVYPPPGSKLDVNTQFYAQPVLDGDTVYIGSWDRHVYALSGERGEVLWAFPPILAQGETAQPTDYPAIEDRIIGGLAVGHGNVYFGIANHNVFAVDAETGQYRWYFHTEHGVWSTPLVLDDQVIITSLDHHIYSLNPDTGELNWQRDLGGAVAGTPVYDPEADVLYVGSFINTMYALDAAANGEGEILFDYATEGWVWDGPALVDGVLYFGDMNGYFYALEPDLRASEFVPIWQPRKVAAQGIRATPLVAGDYVVFGARDGNLYALNRVSGVQNWVQAVGLPLLEKPLLIQDGEGDDLVLISTMDNTRLLVAYRLDSGAEAWQYPLPQAE